MGTRQQALGVSSGERAGADKASGSGGEAPRGAGSRGAWMEWTRV